MANQQGPARRNGIIEFQMAGGPTPVIPLVSPPYMGPIPAPPRGNGPVGVRMPPAPASAIPYLSNQGPPHGITPLVGPDTAHSFPSGVRPRQTSREVTALNASLADAEGLISRQESNKNNLESQVSALRSQMATHRTTRFVDPAHMDALINRSCNDRARDIDRQFQILEDRLDQVSEDLERAEGNQAALQGLQYAFQKDRRDVQDLRQIVAAAEFNLQHQKRLAGAEDRLKGLTKNLDLMLAAAMQCTRDSQVRTRSAPTAESSTHPVGIARHHVVGSQEPGSHGHAFDLHPQELGKGKERDPGPLLSEGPAADSDTGSVVDNGDCSMRSRSESPSLLSVVDDGDCSMRWRSESPSLLSDVMSLDRSRASSPNDISMEDTDQELAAALLQEDGSQATTTEDWVMPDAPPITTPTMNPQQVENTCMTEHLLDLERLNGEDIDMDWDEEPVTTLNKDDPAAPSQASTDHALLTPSFTVENNAVMISGPAFNAVAPPSYSVHQDAAVEPWQPAKGLGRTYVPTRHAQSARYQRSRVRRDRRSRHVRRLRRTRRVRQMPIESVNMPVRKRTAGVDESSGVEPASKKRITKEVMRSNGSRLLSLSDEYALDNAAKVPVMSVPAVTQPAQTDFQYNEGVSTEQVPTEKAMSAPAVPQPTQAALEATEQVPVDAALSEPAVSEPTQAVSEEVEIIQTEQVPTEAAMSEPAVSKPTQAALEPTVLSNEVVGVPAPSEPAPTKSSRPTPSWTEKIRSVRAVTEPTLNGSDRVVPIQRTDTHSRIEAMRAMRGRVRPRYEVKYALKGLRVTATSRKHSTSSLVASPEDASAKNAVATGTDSRAGVSEGTKRVEDAESPNGSAQKTAGDLQEETGGEEVATSGLQMPGAWPSDPPIVTASGESDMHEGSALLRGLWAGTRWVSFGVFAMVMATLLSSPLWLGRLGHLVYAFEGPEQFLEELREEHGYVPFLEWIIHVLLRSFAGDRTLYG
ncbi:unnamed protein product [Penicillium nalgiovense]|uniref:Uncharacterized protein n=1 Tax=Penicillium nalgiovense TaxID=60175 RepID=A0A9W4MIS5_PENNA|nr:unnamed protein product [Penicillium nalgiovense]CAG7943657.1 unnamed protein product [Penicillium nalgiovense]CAG7953551.1 unnamed protein product [Penicillium nalgiovense]CAG7956503.1 unnamed protein product [Penicillium nalgiovense]CAG7959593.1 unnamed protein product [Penicillium nalgiovense]